MHEYAQTHARMVHEHLSNCVSVCLFVYKAHTLIVKMSLIIIIISVIGKVYIFLCLFFRVTTSLVCVCVSCSWSRSGRKLLSSSTDWNVMLWDVATGELDLRLRFPSPILLTQFHPRNTSASPHILYHI